MHVFIQRGRHFSWRWVHRNHFTVHRQLNIRREYDGIDHVSLWMIDHLKCCLKSTRSYGILIGFQIIHIGDQWPIFPLVISYDSSIKYGNQTRISCVNVRLGRITDHYHTHMYLTMIFQYIAINKKIQQNTSSMGISGSSKIVGKSQFWPWDFWQQILLQKYMRRWSLGGIQRDPHATPKVMVPPGSKRRCTGAVGEEMIGGPWGDWGRSHDLGRRSRDDVYKLNNSEVIDMEYQWRSADHLHTYIYIYTCTYIYIYNTYVWSMGYDVYILYGMMWDDHLFTKIIQSS